MANILPSTREHAFLRAVRRLMADEHWTVTDLAKWMKVSRPTAYIYLDDAGKIPGHIIFDLMSRMESNGIEWRPER